MDTFSTCSFCGSGRAFGPYERHHVCAACAKRVAELAQRSHPESVSSIWPSRGDAMAVPCDVIAQSGGSSLAPFVPVSDMIHELETAVAAHVSREDVRARLDLADAYREMDLYDDALEEAAFALTSTNDGEMIDRALRLLLTAPLLRPGGFTALRARLTLN